MNDLDMAIEAYERAALKVQPNGFTVRDLMGRMAIPETTARRKINKLLRYGLIRANGKKSVITESGSISRSVCYVYTQKNPE